MEFIISPFNHNNHKSTELQGEVIYQTKRNIELKMDSMKTDDKMQQQIRIDREKE